MKKFEWSQIDEIVQALNEHEILAFPTDTVYGVGVPYGDLNDLRQLKLAKHRPEEKPIPMMISSIDQIDQIAKISLKTKKLIETFMPGGITLIVPLKDTIDREYTNGKDTIALRMPDCEPLLEVIRRLERPMMVTSANMSGQPTALTYTDALMQLPHIDGIVKGECHDLLASTIVDCTTNDFTIVRQGAISKEKIEEVLK